MFHIEGLFVLEFDDCLIEPQLGHWFWKYVPQELDPHWNGVNEVVNRCFVWENHKKNLEKYYNSIAVRECTIIWSGWKGHQGTNGICWTMFEMVDQLKALPWSTIEKVLDKYYEGLQLAGSDWEVGD